MKKSRGKFCLDYLFGYNGKKHTTWDNVQYSTTDYYKSVIQLIGKFCLSRIFIKITFLLNKILTFISLNFEYFL